MSRWTAFASTLLLMACSERALLLPEPESSPAVDSALLPIDMSVTPNDPNCPGVGGEVLWQKQFATATGSNAIVAVAPSGVVAVSGEFAGQIDLGGTTYEEKQAGFVVLYDPNGKYLWSRDFGPVGFAASNGLVLDADENVTLVVALAPGTTDFGPGSSPITETQFISYLVSYDRNGTFRWARPLSNGYAPPLVTDGAGNVYLAGTLSGSVDLGGGIMTGSGDLVIAKLSQDGDYEWSYKYPLPPNSSSWITDVSADAAGNLFVTRQYETATVGAGEIRAFDANGLPRFTTPSASGTSWRIGTPRMGQMDFSFTEMLTAEKVGNLHLLRLSTADGSKIWERSFKDQPIDFYTVIESRGVELDPDGALVWLGRYRGTIDFGEGSFSYAIGMPPTEAYVLAKVDEHGDMRWSKNLPALFTGNDLTEYQHFVKRIGVDAQSNVYVIGGFTGTLEVCGTPLTSPLPSSGNLFLLKIAP